MLDPTVPLYVTKTAPNSFDWGSVFSGAFRYFAHFAAVWLAFGFGQHFARIYPKKVANYLVVVGLIGFFCLLFWANYGTHIENSDPLYGGGDAVVGFVPSDKERNERAAILFTALILPALYGVWKKQRSSD